MKMKCFMKRNVVSGLLVLALGIGTVTPVSAKNPDDNQMTVSDESVMNQNDKLRYGERDVVTVVHTDYKTTTVTPSGQTEGGYRFPNGGGIYINTSGGPTVTVNFSVSWGKVVSTGVSVGVAGRSSSIGGLYVPVPNKTNYYKVKVDKTYKIEYCKVDQYQYNEYKGTFYITRTKLYSESAYPVKVK